MTTLLVFAIASTGGVNLCDFNLVHAISRRILWVEDLLPLKEVWSFFVAVSSLDHLHVRNGSCRAPKDGAHKYSVGPLMRIACSRHTSRMRQTRIVKPADSLLSISFKLPGSVLGCVLQCTYTFHRRYRACCWGPCVPEIRRRPGVHDDAKICAKSSDYSYLRLKQHWRQECTIETSIIVSFAVAVSRAPIKQIIALLMLSDVHHFLVNRALIRKDYYRSL